MSEYTLINTIHRCNNKFEILPNFNPSKKYYFLLTIYSFIYLIYLHNYSNLKLFLLYLYLFLV